MTDSFREAVMSKALAGVDEVKLRFDEIAQHLKNNDLLAAMDAIAGLANRIEYVETVLTLLRDLEAREPKSSDS